MNKDENQLVNVYEEQKKLVLARLQTSRPETKIMLGSNKDVSVKELIVHVRNDDEFGKKLVKAQINMLKVLASSA